MPVFSSSRQPIKVELPFGPATKLEDMFGRTLDRAGAVLSQENPVIVIDPSDRLVRRAMAERIRFHAPLSCPIFTYTIKDKKGTDLSGTNTMYEGADVKPVKEGDVYDVSFTQKMTLQGGEYLLSMSCTGFEGEEHVVYHRLYDVANITVISNKNTVGVFDMESQVKTELTKAEARKE